MPTPYSKEQLAKMEKAKGVARNISAYLNSLEEICATPMGDQEKVEAFNQISLYVGKAMVAFSNLCDITEIFAERGVRGGKIRKENEDDFEYVEGD